MENKFFGILEPTKISLAEMDMEHACRNWAYGRDDFHGTRERAEKSEKEVEHARQKYQELTSRSNHLRHYFTLIDWLKKEARSERASYAPFNINYLLDCYFKLIKDPPSKLDLKSPQGVVKYLLFDDLTEGEVPHVTDLRKLLEILQRPPPIFSQDSKEFILREADKMTRFYHDPCKLRHLELNNESLERAFQDMGFEV